jgi:hypothetical protein
MKTCQFTGCGRPASSQYSRFCNHHRSRNRRNGDPAQRGITKADLKPYEDMVRRRIARNPTNPTWEKMDARWGVLVHDCQNRLNSFNAGMAMAQQFVQAATEIVRLAEDVSPCDVVVTASAMFLMQTMAGHMFRSQAAFDIQLARRVRGLTASNATAYRDPKTGKARRIYRELSPRAAATMSEWLRMTFGVLGARLAHLEEQDQRQADAERLELSDALMELK